VARARVTHPVAGLPASSGVRPVPGVRPAPTIRTGRPSARARHPPGPRHLPWPRHPPGPVRAGSRSMASARCTLRLRWHPAPGHPGEAGCRPDWPL